MRLRRYLYESGPFGSHAVGIPVLSVGNIALGGSGKSPLIREIARGNAHNLLRDTGFSPRTPIAVLSRGYGRKSRGWRLVSEGAGPLIPVEDSGDEARMLAQQCPGVMVAVCEDRVEGALRLKALGARTLLLDDAFQHMRIKRDTNLLVWRSDQDPARSACLPFGPFREAPLAALSASALVFSRGSDEQDQACADYFSQLFLGNERPTPPFFKMKTQISELCDPWTLEVADTQGVTRLGAFCALGDPAAFWRSLRQKGFDPVFCRSFRDHHTLLPRELDELVARATHEDCQALVCTWKDAVKLKQQVDFPLFVADQQIELTRLESRYE